VVSARNAVEALAALPAIARPCLVLLGLWMPMLDGERFLDFLERMPDRDEFFVVVVSAASYATAMRSRPEVAGVLRKPFSVEELMAVVHGLPEWSPLRPAPSGPDHRAADRTSPPAVRKRC
jgi:CheY-like chemotaxis protein